MPDLHFCQPPIFKKFDGWNRILVEQIFSLPEADALVRRAIDQQEGG